MAPALGLTLSISALVVFLLGDLGDCQRFARQGIATLLLGGNIGAFKYSGDYFSPNPNPLVHTWSLSVEEQIYIFLPLILMLIVFKQTKVRKRALLSMVGITALSFLFFALPTLLTPIYREFGIQGQLSQINFYSPLARIWQFTFGGIAYFLYDRSKDKSRKTALGGQIVLLTILGLVLLFPKHVELRIGSIIASGLAVLVLLLRSLDVIPKFLASPLEWVGDRSYSIYLVHMPILYIAKYSPDTAFGSNRLPQTFLGVCLSVLLGSLSYSKIEQKYRYSGIDNSPIIGVQAAISIFILVPMLLMISVIVLQPKLSALGGAMPVPSAVTPWDWDRNCKFFSDNAHNEELPCLYGDSNAKDSILLIGDSQAASDSRAVIDLAKSLSMKAYVYTFTACEFILDKSRLDTKYTYTGLSPECLQHNARIMKFVETQDPKIVVYAHHSSTGFITPETAKSRESLRNVLLSNLLELEKVAPKILVIGANPELLSGSSGLDSFLNFRGEWSNAPFEDNLFWKAHLSHTSIKYTDVVRIFCPNRECRNRQDGVWLFQDKDHLSLAGSMMLLPSMRSNIESMLVD